MRSYFSSGLIAFALCAGATVFLSSCGDDDGVNVRRTVQASAYTAMPVDDYDQVFVLPASFTVTGASIEDAMAPEAVKLIGRLKPEYEEALATDALNFTEVRRRT